MKFELNESVKHANYSYRAAESPLTCLRPPAASAASADTKRWHAADIPLKEAAVPYVVDPVSIREGIEDLSQQEMHGLLKIGDICRFGTNWTALDLAHEAIVLTMNGTRRWKEGASMFYHLAGVIRSTAFGERRKASREVQFTERYDDSGDLLLDEPASTEPNPERLLMGAEGVERLRERLADEPDALDFLELFMNEDPTRVKQVIGRKRYRELTERLHTELSRLFPDLGRVADARARPRRARANGMRAQAFECVLCRGKVCITQIVSGSRWVCDSCKTGFGPVWQPGEVETALVGVRPWPAVADEIDPSDTVYLEFSDTRGDSEVFLIWAEKRFGIWSFLERPRTEVRKEVPVQSAIPRLVARAEEILRKALDSQPNSDAAHDDESLSNFIKCILEQNQRAGAVCISN